MFINLLSLLTCMCSTYHIHYSFRTKPLLHLLLSFWPPDKIKSDHLNTFAIKSIINSRNFCSTKKLNSLTISLRIIFMVMNWFNYKHYSLIIINTLFQMQQTFLLWETFNSLFHIQKLGQSIRISFYNGKFFNVRTWT